MKKELSFISPEKMYVVVERTWIEKSESEVIASLDIKRSFLSEEEAINYLQERGYDEKSTKMTYIEIDFHKLENLYYDKVWPELFKQRKGGFLKPPTKKIKKIQKKVLTG